jgi:hypothetical protein
MLSQGTELDTLRCLQTNLNSKIQRWEVTRPTGVDAKYLRALLVSRMGVDNAHLE